MRDIYAGRVGGARTVAAVVAMLAAVAPPLVAVAPAVAAAPRATALVAEPGPDGGLSVSATMTVGSTHPGEGDEVTVEITLTNTGPRALSVSVDEVFGGVLDDAATRDRPRSSDPELTLMRLGHDRVALMGELGAGARATVEYTVVVAPVNDRGDGVLRRVLVPADAAVTCGDGVAPSESAVLGSCTEIALVDGPRPSGTSSERTAPVADTGASADGAAADGAAADGAAADGASGSGALAGALTADGATAVNAETSVAGSQPLVLVAAAALSLLLLGAAIAVALIRRSRAARPAVRRASAHPAPAVRARAVRVPGGETTPAAAPRAASTGHGRRVVPPVVAAPHFDSRRERRLAERRLVERGLALPVA